VGSKSGRAEVVLLLVWALWAEDEVSDSLSSDGWWDVEDTNETENDSGLNLAVVVT